MTFMPYKLSMGQRTYRRGQVEWALWKFSTIDLPSGDEPLSAFRARVKHLLQLDRSGTNLGHPADPPPVEYALSSGQPAGTGVDALFTAFDTFCLAIAMDLLRAGFKQSEVALLMMHLRPRLEAPFARILTTPPAFTSRLAKGAGPHSTQSSRGDDRRVFLVIQQVEFSETFPAFADLQSKRSKEAIHREPIICHGIDALRDKLDQMDHLFRRAIVLEIAQTAARISEFLEKAPLKRRGRPAHPV
jgi:hypothetical protein